MKINWNFHFHTSLWYLKRFYEDLEGLKALKALIHLSEMHGAGGVTKNKLRINWLLLKRTLVFQISESLLCFETLP